MVLNPEQCRKISRLKVRMMRETAHNRLQRPAAAEQIPKKKLERIRAIILDLQAKRIDSRKLPRSIRWRIVQYFMEIQPEVTNTAIADLIGVTRITVGNIKRALIRDAAFAVTDLDAKEVMSGYLIHKNAMQAIALSKKDYWSAFKMETEYLEKLADFGFIKYAPQGRANRNLNSILNKELEDFTREFGVPTPAELVAALRAGRQLITGGAPGIGNGNPRILSAPILDDDSEDNNRDDQEGQAQG
jgi:guanyl-specific ribonuclease Sa